jgi:hypothetical protein
MQGKVIAAAVLVAAAACVPPEGPTMRPFEDCLGCHDGSGAARGWTAAGTWYQGSEVVLVDKDGKSVTLHGNSVGNFYTAEPMTFPLSVWVDGKRMVNHTTGNPIPLGYGGCNVCHHATTLTTGPLMAPGQDCLKCHGPSGMATEKFSAAGTAVRATFPVGSTVSVGGQTTTTNQVGNFWFTSPPAIAFPVTASVGGSIMEGGAPRGGCNGCHVGGVGSGNTIGGN